MESGSPVKYPVYPDKLELLGRTSILRAKIHIIEPAKLMALGVMLSSLMESASPEKNVLVTSGNPGALKL
jgi:hypothetical protein